MSEIKIALNIFKIVYASYFELKSKFTAKLQNSTKCLLLYGMLAIKMWHNKLRK